MTLTKTQLLNILLTAGSTLVGVFIAQWLAIRYDRRRAKQDAQVAQEQVDKRAGLAYAFILKSMMSNQKFLLELERKLRGSVNQIPDATLLDTTAWETARNDVHAGDDRLILHEDLCYYFVACGALKRHSSALEELAIRFNCEPNAAIQKALQRLLQHKVDVVVQLLENILTMGLKLSEQIKAVPSYVQHGAKAVMTEGAYQELVNASKVVSADHAQE